MTDLNRLYIIFQKQYIYPFELNNCCMCLIFSFLLYKYYIKKFFKSQIFCSFNSIFSHPTICCYRAGGDGGGRTHKKNLQSFQFAASLRPHKITLCIKTDKAFITPNSACIVEPAALYTLCPGFS